VPWHDLGVRFTVSDGDLLSLLALVLPVALLLSALLLCASTFARSFKEAQGYLTILMLIPMLPGILSAVYPLSNRPWLAPVPVLGQYALSADVLAGKPPGLVAYLIAGTVSIVLALVLVATTARLLRRESIIFGR